MLFFITNTYVNKSNSTGLRDGSVLYFVLLISELLMVETKLIEVALKIEVNVRM